MHDINLLRPVIEHEREVAGERARYSFYITFTVILILTVTLAVFGARFSISTQNKSLDSQISSLECDVSEVESTEDNINNFNNTITQLKNLDKNKFTWSLIYDNIAKSTPYDIKLTQVSLITSGGSTSTSASGGSSGAQASTANQKLKITGETKSRRSVALFQDKLQKIGGSFVVVDIISSKKTEGDAVKNQQEKIDFEINISLKAG
jgi:Tfp pilus assembly protein PilN